MKGLRETDARYTETAVSAAEKAVDETERGLSLSYARTLSWCSLAVVLLTLCSGRRSSRLCSPKI